MSDLPQETSQISLPAFETNDVRLIRPNAEAATTSLNSEDSQLAGDKNLVDNETVLDFGASTLGEITSARILQGLPEEANSLEFVGLGFGTGADNGPNQIAMVRPGESTVESLDFRSLNVYSSPVQERTIGTAPPQGDTTSNQYGIEDPSRGTSLDFLAFDDLSITGISSSRETATTTANAQAPFRDAVFSQGTTNEPTAQSLEFGILRFEDVLIGATAYGVEEELSFSAPVVQRSDEDKPFESNRTQPPPENELQPPQAAENSRRDQTPTSQANETPPQRPENQQNPTGNDTRATERTEAQGTEAARPTPRVNQWEFAGSARRGVDRMRMQSSYTVPNRDFFAANPTLERRMPEPGGTERYSLRHPTTGQVDTGWTLSSVDRGNVTLTRSYEIEVQSRENHDGLIEALPGVPERFQRQLQDKLNELPENVRNSLARHGYRIIAAPTIPDAIPELARLSPRGWDRDLSFLNSDGTHDDVSKRIIAPMRFRVNGEMVDVDRENVLTHQVGHALDFAHNFLSSRDEFIRAYTRDMEGIRNREKRENAREADYRVEYLSQASGVGRQETFASIFGLLTTGPENESDRVFFERNFPSVIEVVRQQIKDLK